MPPPDNKETEFGTSDQKVSPSAGKNIGVFLVPCRACKCALTVTSGGVDILGVPWCHLL